jgi:ankyrin repeat protein
MRNCSNKIGNKWNSCTVNNLPGIPHNSKKFHCRINQIGKLCTHLLLNCSLCCITCKLSWYKSNSRLSNWCRLKSKSQNKFLLSSLHMIHSRYYNSHCTLYNKSSYCTKNNYLDMYSLHRPLLNCYRLYQNCKRGIFWRTMRLLLHHIQ